ncbi:hypothetical protein BACCAP_04511 [Pseudoflavonifractor capillosus ATCC 29799]|uniref:Uncharacterized protein n=2 Tax=Pseudoflavonifractor capillosus TaxID=106588 RepID=A6P1Y2_9FIRM|nr:hypothetical protein BACCAP_04511 [Pseudoflavonifractor capillosus ATCC 29799]
MPAYRSVSGSSAEDLFIELFSDASGAEKAGYLYSWHLFSEIYQIEFVRRVDVQTETIERYVREGLLVPDLVVEKANSICAKGGYTDTQAQ